MILRRRFLKSTMALALLTKLGIFSSKVLAARPESLSRAFLKDNPEAALAELFPGQTITPTDQITIEMPAGAENGAIVPVTIKTDLQGIHSISIIGEKNPIALIAQFSFQGKASGQYLRTRIKLAKSSNVIVVMDIGGELCSAQKYIDVLKGGCDL